jgi:hypothetical protein
MRALNRLGCEFDDAVQKSRPRRTAAKLPVSKRCATAASVDLIGQLAFGGAFETAVAVPSPATSATQGLSLQRQPLACLIFPRHGFRVAGLQCGRRCQQRLGSAVKWHAIPLTARFPRPCVALRVLGSGRSCGPRSRRGHPIAAPQENGICSPSLGLHLLGHSSARLFCLRLGQPAGATLLAGLGSSPETPTPDGVTPLLLAS